MRQNSRGSLKIANVLHPKVGQRVVWTGTWTRGLTGVSKATKVDVKNSRYSDPERRPLLFLGKNIPTGRLDALARLV